ncbi:MAG: hypothetical protein HY698_05160 [Deltaproteobacteria bacterium]|nr:hypothetical protein [Deltaproteobacteria bacterium]
MVRSHERAQLRCALTLVLVVASLLSCRSSSTSNTSCGPREPSPPSRECDAVVAGPGGVFSPGPVVLTEGGLVLVDTSDNEADNGGRGRSGTARRSPSLGSRKARGRFG